MTDVAALTFSIDSSQARQAVAALEALRQSSASITQQNQTQTASFTNLNTSYNQSRDQIDRLAASTRAYDGTLQGLITRLDALRASMNQTQQGFNQYQLMITQATGAAIGLNATVDALDRYVSKARELRIQQNDLATGLNNITLALKNQTAEGHNARMAIEQLGVSLKGIGADRPEEVVQRIAERLRGVQSNQYTLRGTQQIFGQGFSANDLLNLQSQPFIGYRQQQGNDIQRNLQAQIDAINVGNQRRSTETTRRDDERSDLSSRFSQSNTVAGRLGIDFVAQIQHFFTQTQSQELAELRRIKGLPEDQKSGYQGYGSQIGDFFQTGFGGQMSRVLFSGQFGNQVSEIKSRQDRDIQDSGYIRAWLNRLGREAQAAVGVYQPQNADERGITPFETLTKRQEAGQRLSTVGGDPAYSDIVNLQEQQRQFTSGASRQDYLRAFGAQEGERRYSNQLGALQQKLIYARDPSQRLATDTISETQINALPFEQRALGRFRQQATEEITGTRGGSLSLPQQRTVDERFQSGLAGQLQSASEDTKRQVDFQRQLSEELTKGRAAAEDYTRAWTEYISALSRGASSEQAQQQAIEAVNLAIQQRITQGRAVTLQLREENDTRQQQIDLARRNANADPVTRRTQELQLGITRQIEVEQRAGTLPNLRGEFRDPAGKVTSTIASPEAQRVVEQRRAELGSQLSGQSVQGAQSLRQGVQDQVRDQQTIADIMQKQGASLDRATEAYRTNQQFNEQIAKQQAAGNEAAVKELETLREQTQEFQHQVDITKQVVSNLEAARSAAEETQGNKLLQGLSPAAQSVLRPMLPLINQNLQSSQALPLIEHYESGGKNQPNYRYDREHTAGGYYQMTDTTWREMAPKLGINLPTAMSASHEQQKQVATRLYEERGAAPWATNQPLMGAMTSAAATNVGAGAGLTPGQIARLDQQINEMAAGRPFSFAGLGLPPEMQRTLEEAGTQRQQAVRSGQQLQVGNQGAAVQARVEQLRQQAQLTPGEAARVPLQDTTLLPGGPREQQAAQQTQGVIAQQAAAARRQMDDLNNSIHQEQERLAALDGPLQGYGTRLREVNAQLQAEEMHRQNPSIDVEIAKRGLLAEATLKQKAALEEQNHALQEENELVAAQTAAGPFATPAHLRHVNTETQIKQFTRDNPDLAASPQGQQHIQEMRNKEVLANQAEQMGELREAAHGAESAIEGAMTALIVRGEKGKDVMKSLGQTLEEMFLKNVIYKPFERGLDQLMSNIFGGGDEQKKSSNNGGGSGSGGSSSGGLFSSIGKFLFGDGGEGQTKSSRSGGGGVVPANDNSGMLDTYSNLLGMSDKPSNDNGSALSGAATGNSADSTNGVVNAVSSLLGGGKTVNGLPIDTNYNAVRVIMVGGNGQNVLGQVTGDSSKDGGGGLFGMIGKLFGGGSGGKSNDPVDVAIRRANGEPPSSTDTSSSGGLLDSIGKLFSGNSSGNSNDGGLIGKGLDSLFGKNFTSNGGLLGSLFGSGSGGSDSSGGGGGLLGSLFGGGSSGGGGGFLSSLFGSGGGGGGLADLTGGAMSAGLYANGAVFPGSVLADYHNQVVDRPTVFAFARGVGLMGEAGPEAVMPLRRGADGRLGVSAPTDGGTTHIHFNITTPDADSFRRAQPQIQQKATTALGRTSQRNSPAA